MEVGEIIMTDVAQHTTRGSDRRIKAADDSAPPPGKTLHFIWLLMDPDGDTPPPQDGKWLWLSPDGGDPEKAVEAYWKHTRHHSQQANGGRGGWIITGWWCYKFPPNMKIDFDPKGWAPRND